MSAALTVDDLRVRLSQFGVYDYVVFFVVTVGCAAVGIYNGFRGRQNGSVEEYFLGGRTLSSFPVALSLVSSFITGLTLLETPAEIYLYGTEYMFVLIAFFLAGLASSYLFLPVFHEMKLLSIYEYLQKRFDENVKLFGCLMFTMSQICWLPVVIYLPALAFHEVTGVDLLVVTPAVCLLCIFYTCTGGMKAVVWTDVFQIALMVSCLLLLTIKGVMDAGDFQKVFQKNQEGGRFVLPSFTWDLTLRHNFWAVTFGGFISFIHQTILNQNLLQKYLSLPSLTHARRALWMFVVGTTALILISCCTGFVIYATYHDCDPLTTKLVSEKNQLLPLLLAKVTGDSPGLAGLLTAGVFSASFSSFSTGLISTSAVGLEDLIKVLVRQGRMGVGPTNVFLRGVVLLLGVLFLLLIFVLKEKEIVLRLPIGLASMTSGPMLGIFFSGMFLPWVNGKGALLGGVLGLLGNGFVIIGAQNAIASNRLVLIPKPTSVESCLYYYNATAILSVAESNGNGDAFPLFKLGYLWHTAFGAFITVTSAVAISAMTGFTDVRKVNSACFSPIVRKLLPPSRSHVENKKLLM